MRRVVVTGIGMVTPIGCGVNENWKNLIASKSGIKKIERFDASNFPARIAAEIIKGEGEGQFNPDNIMSKKEQRKVDDFIIYATEASEQALKDAGWAPEDEESLTRTGVSIGSGIGGLPFIESNVLSLDRGGPRKVSPFFIPGSLINLASGQISMRHGFMGPNHAVVTACATGTHAIGDSARMIQFGNADVMVAGGAESAICGAGFAGFSACRALSTNFNDTPEKGSRPWDKDRDGFVMGEGAGVLILEEYEHAKKRGAKIYCELVGYGLSGDAHHITAPHPEGKGAYNAMKQAFDTAKLDVTAIDYINAHGTSTPLGDEIEVGAVKRLFGDHAYKVAMSSTKSSIGHLLGAAGSVEAIYSILAMQNNIAPPTLNLDNPSEGCDLDFVPHYAKDKDIKCVLSNSFGFGGTNASLIFKQI